MTFGSKLQIKAAKRTARKLVFRSETGELVLIRENQIRPYSDWSRRGDINIDQIFYAEGQF